MKIFLATIPLVHVHHPFLSGSLAKRYCLPWGIPIVFTNHTRYDLYIKAYLPILPEHLAQGAVHSYLPGFCKAVDLVIAPSEGLKKILIKLGVDVFIDVVPNGIDLKPFENICSSKKRDELGINNEDILFIYTGRLSPEKNIPFLLNSFTGVAKKYNHIKLLLVGTGAKDEVYKQMAQDMGLVDRVIFTGFVPYEELPSYLCIADAYVTASVTEVHPLSVIEAMASGCIPVVINKGGQKEIIKDGEDGFLFESWSELKDITLRICSGDINIKAVRGKAMRSCRRFSSSNFDKGLLSLVKKELET